MSKLAKRLDAHFVAVAAAGVAGVAAVNTADAAIVHSGVVNIDGVYLNVVTGANGAVAPAGYDINPYSALAGQFNLWGPSANTWLSTGGVIAGPYNLAPGTPIVGAAAAFFRPGGGTNVGLEMNLNSSNNLLGFRFANEANGGQFHFGWVRFSFGATAGQRTIVEYAYEDVAETAIPAGAVPAPGSLALLTLGALGLAGRRRK
jgi:hypothetical protein